MKSEDLFKYLEKDNKSLSKFNGIFAIDDLIFPISDMNGYLICNTDESYNKGKHWVVIYIDKNKKEVEYFDSLGKRPCERFIKFMREDSNNYIIHNTKKLQSSLSDSCGFFCLYFIYFRCRNINYKSIIDNFSSSTYENEKHVEKFIKQAWIKKFMW